MQDYEERMWAPEMGQDRSLPKVHRGILEGPLRENGTRREIKVISFEGPISGILVTRENLQACRPQHQPQSSEQPDLS